MAFNFEDIPESAYDSIIQELFGDRALVEHGKDYNFVCPVCGDMAMPNKKKAYIYKDHWQYVCFKCGSSVPFTKFLKEEYPELYQRLLYLAFGSQSSERKPVKKEERKVPDLPFVDGELISITANHPLAKAGLDLCKERRIRADVYEGWYVCQEGDQFLHRDATGNYIINPNTGKPVGNEYKNRIIIPFYRFGGSWTQFDARAIDKNNPMRYRNFEGAKRSAYNIDFVNFNRPFYILEGTIDSTFIHNSIAIGGIKHLDEVLRENPQIMANINNATIIWDNDDAGRQAMWQSCEKGFKWFDWDGITDKDINGTVMHSNILPLDEDGYVAEDAIQSRVRNAAASHILFALRFGNVKKEAYKKQQAAMRNAREKRKENKYGAPF